MLFLPPSCPSTVHPLILYASAFSLQWLLQVDGVTFKVLLLATCRIKSPPESVLVHFSNPAQPCSNKWPVSLSHPISCLIPLCCLSLYGSDSTSKRCPSTLLLPLVSSFNVPVGNQTAKSLNKLRGKVCHLSI